MISEAKNFKNCVSLSILSSRMTPNNYMCIKCLQKRNYHASCKPRPTGKPRVTSTHFHSKYCYRLGWTAEGSVSQHSCDATQISKPNTEDTNLTRTFLQFLTSSIIKPPNEKGSQWQKQPSLLDPKFKTRLDPPFALCRAGVPQETNVVACDLVTKGQTTHLQLWCHAAPEWLFLPQVVLCLTSEWMQSCRHNTVLKDRNNFSKVQLLSVVLYTYMTTMNPKSLNHPKCQTVFKESWKEKRSTSMV